MSATPSSPQPSAVSVIFPMAGRGERFGGTFKPFLPVGNETFLEAAVRPFRNWLAAIPRFYCVFLQEQEEVYGVTVRLQTLFPDLPVEAVILPEPTAGPAVTFTNAVAQKGLTGPAIICDCDHAVDVDPLFERIEADATTDCIVPVWNLDGEDISAWSVAAIEPDGRVTAIAEKRRPAAGSRFMGVIGCYFFREISTIAAMCQQHGLLNVSDAIARLIADGRRVVAVPIHTAEFFGDPRRLARTIESRQEHQPAARQESP